MAKYIDNRQNASINPIQYDPASRLINEIDGMELKKRSLVSAIQNEITVLKQKADFVFHQIGVDMYNAYKKGGNNDDKLTSHFNEVEQINKVIEEKEAKSKDIVARYDDEIGMMKSSLGTAAPAVMIQPGIAQAQGGSVCPKCAVPYTPGADIFCMGCGYKLS